MRPKPPVTRTLAPLYSASSSAGSAAGDAVIGSARSRRRRGGDAEKRAAPEPQARPVAVGAGGLLQPQQDLVGARGADLVGERERSLGIVEAELHRDVDVLR